MPEIKIRKRCKYAGDVFVALLKMGYGIEAANAFCDNIKDADVEEVVRCKDCKWCYINKFGAESLTGMCTQFSRVVQHSDFCSYAEKRNS